MGFDDREYLREEAKRYGEGRGGGFYSSELSGPPEGKKRMVTLLVIVCVVLYLLDAFTGPVREEVVRDGSRVTVTVSNQLFDFFALKSQDVFSSRILQAPWNVYQLLSYGFAHMSMSTDRSIFHIFGNMLVLWMLGRMVEDRYGRMEFLWFYLAAIVFSGIVWGIFNLGTHSAVVGASGAVTAVVVLFALTFPNHKVYLFGVLEMPGWLLGVLIVAQDFIMALLNTGDRVAYEAHLGGAAFGAAYFYLSLRIENYLPSSWATKMLGRRGPSLKVHHPDEGQEFPTEDPMDPNYERDAELADRILDKVHTEGEASLTRKERKILQRFSKRVRKKRND